MTEHPSNPQGSPDAAMAPVDRSAHFDPSWPAAVEVFDTTLRDGAQFEGISLTVEDKLAVATALDELGVHWIEGGYPGANPKDEEFFRSRHRRAVAAAGAARRLRLHPQAAGPQR